MRKSLLFLLAAFAFQSFAVAQGLSEKLVKKHITYLASDKLEGRGTATPAERKAADYIAKQFKKAGIAGKGQNNTWFFDFTFRRSTDPHGMSKDGPEQTGRNVVGYLDNGAENTVIIGAHYDHLGLGHDHNSLDPNPEGKIHNGADDNASGVAGVIELARYLSKNGVKEKHNFLFICFSGEELGLLGSKKYADNPTIDFSKVSFMLNMDMIGRLNEENRLLVGGVGTSPVFVPLIRQLSSPELTIKQDSAGIGPSDHTSFYLKNIPVLFVFTGQHGDYHKPSDDVEKINFPGLIKVLNFVRQIVEKLDAEPKLAFQETKAKTEDTPRFKVTLGIMPDYTYEGEGVRVDGVTDGKPAAKAGIQKGDIIVKMGDLQITNMQAYMKGLSQFKKGDTVPVTVKRDKDEKTMKATF